MLRRRGINSLNLSKGFTLIELLVVIAIIAILATIVILNVSSARTKAQDAKVMEDITTIAKAAEMARVENGTLPTIEPSLLNPGIAFFSVEKTIAASDFISTPKSYASSLGQLTDSKGNKLIGSNPKHPIADEYYYFHSTPDRGGYYAISGMLSQKDSNGNNKYRVQMVGHTGVNKNGNPLEVTDGGLIDFCYERFMSKIDKNNNYVLGKDIRALAGTGQGDGGGSAATDCTKND